MNDNHPATFAEYMDVDPEPRKGRCINIIADDIEPLVARNIATYYRAKEEPWADGMARRLEIAAHPVVAPANDNKRRKAKKVAA